MSAASTFEIPFLVLNADENRTIVHARHKLGSNFSGDTQEGTDKPNQSQTGTQGN